MSEQPIPAEALASHIAILGKTGSGKSNAAKTIVETAMDAGERVCIFDPTGTWYGLRLTASGKPSAYPVVIFGGQHADVRINGHQGAAVAEIIGTTSTPAVIDTRLMTVSDRTRFFTDFAEAIIRVNLGALTLVLDEAHVFAPQGRVADPQSGKMLHATNNLINLGRGIGFRIIMITQRPAKLHKDSLSAVETIVAMRLIAPQDRNAIKDWISESDADPVEGRGIISSLPSLPTGDAWIWSPELGVLKRDHFPLAKTFDSGKAPAIGSAAVALAPLDLSKIQAQLATVEADTKANNPAALKATIAVLERDLKKATTIRAEHLPAEPKTITVVANAEEIEAARAEGEQIGVAKGLAKARAALDAVRVDGDAVAPASRARRPARAVAITSAAPRLAESAAPGGSVPAGCSKPLASLASVYPAGMTEAQWATAAGYKRSGGTWGTYKSRLRGADLIEQKDGRWFATASGAEAAGDVELPPPAGPDLVRWWASRLPGTMKIAEAMIEAWPYGMARDELALAVNMSAAGGSFGTYLSRLASPGLIERDGGMIRLSTEAMGPRT
jgi:hypothetical protein